MFFGDMSFEQYTTYRKREKREERKREGEGRERERGGKQAKLSEIANH